MFTLELELRDTPYTIKRTKLLALIIFPSVSTPLRSDLHSEIFQWNRISSQISCQVVKANKTAKLMKEKSGGDGVDKIEIDDGLLLVVTAGCLDHDGI